MLQLNYLGFVFLQIGPFCINAKLDSQRFLESEGHHLKLVYRQHVPARHVPVVTVNDKLKQEFLQLFRMHPNNSKNNGLKTDKPPSLINTSTIAQINELCPRDGFFYTFAPRHMLAMERLQNEFMAQTTASDLFSVAKNTLERDEINRKVWFYALLGTLLQRPDLNGYQLAWSLDATPDLYVTASVLDSALSEKTEGSKTCTIYNGTRGTTRNENKLWYFREDIMLNHHHWYWHQYFPAETIRHPDRRGEVFYYMHHDLIARYNAERLCNGMNVEKALDLRLGGNIGVGYDADLIDKQSGKFWTPRKANVLMTNTTHVNDPDFEIDISPDELSQLLGIFIRHVGQGFLLTKNPQKPNDTSAGIPMDIRNYEGIDYLGNTLDAISKLSVYPELYNPFGLHYYAHMLVTLAADPDFSKKLPAGVMADPIVSLRDPSFYKVHSMVDDICDVHKRTLNPYQLEGGEWPLIWRGVNFLNLKTLSGSERRMNYLKTFWSTHKFPLEQGIDESIHNGSIKTNICEVHLNHRPFRFEFTVAVNNQMTSESGRGTVRIFMAPRNSLNGQRFRMNTTRRLMFQLDSFPVQLRQGVNIITRNSVDSSTTKPWSRSLQQMLQNPGNDGKAEYCGCGWPNHLYVPKGTEHGMAFDLFAMITNFDQDRVQNAPEDLNIPEPCHSPHILCGIPYRKYPDKRPMGYPFDRLPYSTRQGPVNTLEAYVSHVPNMKSTVVTIQHEDILE